MPDLDGLTLNERLQTIQSSKDDLYDARQSQDSDPFGRSAAGLSILLIEDNPADADLVSKYLSGQARQSMNCITPSG